MKILIMGGAGMIGQKLLNLILQKEEIKNQKVSEITLFDIIDAPHPENSSIPIITKSGDISNPKVSDDLILSKTDGLFYEKNNKKPFTAILYAGSAYTAQKYSFTQSQSGRDIDFKSRLAYTAQLVLGRKISNSLSLQISPTILHYNTTKANTSDEKFDNTLMAVGIAARAKITTRTTFNAEWIPVIGNNGNYKNALSIGFDIETGGHVFQLHLTNSRGMSPYQYIGRNDQSWGDGGIHFGFNISRIFNIVNHEE